MSANDIIGGAERVLVALAQDGLERGWHELVVNPFATHPSDSPLARQVAPASYVGLPCAGLRELPALRSGVDRCLRQYRPDVVHVHLFHAEVLVSTLRRGTEAARVLSHQHGRLLLARHRYPEAALDWLAGRRYDRIVACSNDVRQFLLDRYRYPSEKVVTIHNGWAGQPRPTSLRPRDPTVICVANLRPEKGHAVLLRAWRRVVDRLPNARLVLVGGGPLEEELRAQAARLALDGRVEFTGPVEDVWAYLAQAHLFVLPSFHEPFGIVAAEAMAAGLPVVASAVGGLPEFVEPGQTGELVAPGDDRGLADAITDLLGAPERIRQLGVRAATRAAAFTLERTVARYAALYEELLSDRTSRQG